jgi:probable phosphoglycerate mutase
MQGLTMGRRDVALNREGVRDALRAREALARHEVTSIWVSPLRRCRQTARLALGAPTPAPLHVLPELAERAWGQWEGRPASARPGFAESPASAEPYADFEARVLRALTRIHDPAAPLVVAHSGVWRALVRLIQGALPDETARHGELRGLALGERGPTAPGG